MLSWAVLISIVNLGKSCRKHIGQDCGLVIIRSLLIYVSHQGNFYHSAVNFLLISFNKIMLLLMLL